MQVTSGPNQSPAAGKETGDAAFPGCCYQWSASVRTQCCVAYRHQGCSFLMKANDGLRGSLFGQQIGRESILGPPLCLCCGPNMICTCLLLCFLPCWAWPALSGGLCQHGDARRAVKSSIPDLWFGFPTTAFFMTADACVYWGFTFARLIIFFHFSFSLFLLPFQTLTLCKLQQKEKHFKAVVSKGLGTLCDVTKRLLAQWVLWYTYFVGKKPYCIL